jgi:hypothetical protein
VRRRHAVECSDVNSVAVAQRFEPCAVHDTYQCDVMFELRFLSVIGAAVQKSGGKTGAVTSRDSAVRATAFAKEGTLVVVVPVAVAIAFTAANCIMCAITNMFNTRDGWHLLHLQHT